MGLLFCPFALLLHRYASPDPDCPTKGVLAAAAVRMLAPFVGNAIHRTPGVEQAGAAACTAEFFRGRDGGIFCDECVARPLPARCSPLRRSTCRRSASGPSSP